PGRRPADGTGAGLRSRARFAGEAVTYCGGAHGRSTSRCPSRSVAAGSTPDPVWPRMPSAQVKEGDWMGQLTVGDIACRRSGNKGTRLDLTLVAVNIDAYYE